MNLNEILGWSGAGLFVVLSLIQITPLKLDPWSKIAKWIGNALNGDLMKEVGALNDHVDQNEIDRLRWEILDFANSCQRGHKHSQEEFDHIVKMHEKYEEILRRRRETNGQIDLAFEYITTLYKKCQIEHDFLS